MSTAAAAAGNDAHGAGGVEHPPPPAPAALFPAAVAVMCVSSMLFGALAPQALQRRPSMSAAAVWKLAPLVCAYLFSLTAALSGSSTSTAALADSFVRASYLPILAAAADRVSPFAGAAAMFLATAYSTAATARALAHFRLSAAPRRRAEEELERCGLAAAVLVSASIAVAIVSMMSRLAGGGGPAAEAPDSPSPEAFALCVAMSVAGAPSVVVAGMLLLLPESEGPFYDTGSAMVSAVFCWLVAPVCVLGPFGEAVTMVVFVWAGGVAVAALLGYGLAVQACYVQVQRMTTVETRKDGGVR